MLEKEICLSSVLSQAINPPKTHVRGIYGAPTSYHVWPRSCQSDTDPGFHPISSAPPICIFSSSPLHFCSGGVGNFARQRRPDAHKLPKCQHWAPAPSQSLYKTHSSGHCNQFTFPQSLAKKSPTLKCSLSSGTLSLISQHLPLGLSLYSCCQRPEVGSNNGICGL